MTDRTSLCLILAAVLCSSGVSFSQQPEDTLKKRDEILLPKTYRNQRGSAIPYRLFIPDKYDESTKYPLVLFLHGGGGRGVDNLKQIEGGNGFFVDLFTKPESQAEHPCFVLAPQSHDEGWVEYDHITPSTQLGLVLELLETLQKEYSIDEHRLYVLGQSLGGFGTFAIISERPDLFAAAVPICSGGDESRAQQIASLPIWVFHGEKDEAVSVERSRRMVAAMKRAGGKPKYTEYSGEGHIIWGRVVNEPELLPWMFGQSNH